MKGANDDTDAISLLGCIAEREFQLAPNWTYEEVDKQVMQCGNKFKIILDFCGQNICHHYGQNKKEAKNNCAKRALKICAPNLYS